MAKRLNDPVKEIKRCNRCDKIKPWTEFNRRHASPICGRQGHCKVCDIEHGLAYRFVRIRPARTTPEQEEARRASNKLERSGDLLRPEQCTICGCSDPQAHHPDYSKPEIVWYLCRRCHEKAHWFEKYGTPHPDDDQDNPIHVRLS